jgi:hypothetical protein
VVQTPQHIVRRQGEQLFRLDGLGQRRQVLEIVWASCAGITCSSMPPAIG